MNKEKEVFIKISVTFGNIDGNNEMLENAATVQYKLQEVIKHLSIDEQYLIIYEITLLIYKARSSAFEHISSLYEKGSPKELDEYEMKQGIENADTI